MLPDAPAGPRDVAAVVMGAGDIPVFGLRTPASAGLPAGPGHCTADFAVPAVPPLNGAFVVGAQVEDARTGRPLAARRFDDAFWVETGRLPGLLHVPATATVTSAGPPA
ncbi:MAG: hypothetical protein KY442_13890 [Proteobacteria bacterium]|nr:hypothetical protein [Pseudomonadota bacterium]